MRIKLIGLLLAATAAAPAAAQEFEAAAVAEPVVMTASGQAARVEIAQRGEWRGRGGGGERRGGAGAPRATPDRPVFRPNSGARDSTAGRIFQSRERARQETGTVPTQRPEGRSWQGGRQGAAPGGGWQSRGRDGTRDGVTAPATGQFRGGDRGRGWNRGGTGQARDNAGWQRGNDRGDWNRDNDRGRQDWNRNQDRDRAGWNRGNDRGRQDWNRDRNNWSRDRNNWGRSDWGRDRGDWNRGRGDWNRGWRNDRRYDWQGFRRSNRNFFRQPVYYAPRGWGYGYQRFGIGITLFSGLYGQSYWLNDPWAYRLPPAGGGLQWVRYYDDVLLVDVRTGYVVDVIYDFFW